MSIQSFITVKYTRKIQFTLESHVNMQICNNYDKFIFSGRLKGEYP